MLVSTRVRRAVGSEPHTGAHALRLRPGLRRDGEKVDANADTSCNIMCRLLEAQNTNAKAENKINKGADFFVALTLIQNIVPRYI